MFFKATELQRLAVRVKGQHGSRAAGTTFSEGAPPGGPHPVSAIKVPTVGGCGG